MVGVPRWVFIPRASSWVPLSAVPAVHEQLVEDGSASKIAALYVGAYIEEMDMIDINYCPEEIVEQYKVIDTESDCGKVYTDNPDIQRLYGSLLKGSENHLRAFVKNIERREGEGERHPAILTKVVTKLSAVGDERVRLQQRHKECGA